MVAKRDAVGQGAPRILTARLCETPFSVSSFLISSNPPPPSLLVSQCDDSTTQNCITPIADESIQAACEYSYQCQSQGSAPCHSEGGPARAAGTHQCCDMQTRSAPVRPRALTFFPPRAVLVQVS